MKRHLGQRHCPCFRLLSRTSAATTNPPFPPCNAAWATASQRLDSLRPAPRRIWCLAAPTLTRRSARLTHYSHPREIGSLVPDERAPPPPSVPPCGFASGQL